MQGANAFTNAVFFHLWDADFEKRMGRKVWMNAIGDWQHQRSANTFSGYDSPLGGFMVGCDQQFENAILGCAAGYGLTNVAFLDSPASARVDLFNFSTYGRVDYGQAYVGGVMGYTHGWNDVDRTIAISGLDTRHASTTTGGNVFGLLLQTGYNFELNGWRLTPLLGMRYVHDAVDGSTEDGAESINLVVARNSFNSLSSHVGGRLGYWFNRKWRVEGYGQWEHEYADAATDVAMTFAGDMASGFTVEGVSMDREGARTGLLAVGQLNDHLSIRMNYDAFIRASCASQQLTGMMAIGF
jgi:outer membrane autotransporter protein